MQNVFLTGISENTTVGSGGTQFVSVGALADDDVVQSGGVVQDGRFGTVGEAFVHAGGVLDVHGTSDDAEIEGSEVIFSGGIDDEGFAFSGGSVRVSSGGLAEFGTIDSGSVLSVLSGGSADDATVFAAEEIVFSGGADSQMTINSGGLAVLSGGASFAAFIESGGALSVSSGGVASGAFTEATASETVLAGGIAQATGVGGVLRVSSGGVASATKVFQGGDDGVFVGGVARGTVLSGGAEFDYGVTSGTQVLSGGHEFVEAHGTASAAVIGSGGLITVAAGGALAGGLKLWGGKAVISGTVAAGQTVAFAGASEVLELDNLSGFSAKISGLKTANQKIDLGGFTFSGGESVSWTQSGTSGTLTVKDGAKVAHLTLIGTYTSSSFHLSNDSHGGTFVVDPPAAAPAAAGFVQAIAGLSADRGAFVGVHAGGNAVVITALPYITAATSGR